MMRIIFSQLDLPMPNINEYPSVLGLFDNYKKSYR